MWRHKIRMEEHVERRKERRYPIEANVLVKKESGEIIRAIAVDISSSGMRLQIDSQPFPLSLDERVTLDIELPELPEKPFSSWGLGRVAHIADETAGVQLFAGHFGPLPVAHGGSAVVERADGDSRGGFVHND